MQFIMASHGSLAKSMLESAQMIVGQQNNVMTFGLYPEDDVDQLRERIEKHLKTLEGEEIICFTDLYHGSPFNVVVQLMGQYKFHHLTGMNLSMILEALMMRQNSENTIQDICDTVMSEAPATFMDVNKQLDLGE
ncbi:PTS sugar transporter subunit IIA [Xylocopilactobacillus apicola]|uniref:PTS mannose transporter subunit IID n=1 Tax=Xylocopilactobacillus apicola TaxID=2932184 RepID=A0AAU9CUN4_9LACO|nr:PTS sugar transporter subunit IIA [Xylocopilactobacillus apicola]BDR57712.1 PTS mannose transporter subunit IID [Xylocopilactobacillus apicola]